jgi:hypothetical protein
MICLAITLLMYAAYYYLVSVTAHETTVRKVLLAAVACCGQIIMTELLLGVGRVLFLSSVVAVNLLLALLVLSIGYRLRKQAFLPALQADLASLRCFWSAAGDGYTTTLGILLLLVYGWVFVAAWYLPPRGMDDLVYHLPTIFHYIQTHEISLLPVGLRHHFAFPENAELLFMWPTLFAGNQRLVDSINIPFVFLSIPVVYALCRHFAIAGKDAFFAALLYALCPVVIMQAGVNYIDIMVALFFLLGLYFSSLFHSSGSRLYLYAAGACVGLLLGMKYTALLLVLPIQLLIIPGLARSRWRGAVGYVLLIMLFCGWWYGRNFAVFRDPFYPFNFLGPLTGRSGGGGLLTNVALNARQCLSRYLIEDIGIGTCDGGFGLVFWGAGFSSWLYFSVYSALHAGKTGWARCVVLACLPLGFFLLLTVPEADVQYVGRLALFVVAIGLLSFCEVLKILDDKACVSLLKGVCVSLSILSVSLVFDASKPHFNLAQVIADRKQGDNPSEFTYLTTAKRTIRANQGDVWGTLDFLTRDDKSGLNCYLIADEQLFAPSPLYGSNLQNRVVYAHGQFRGAIDAYVCSYYPGVKEVRLDDGTTSYDRIAGKDYVVVSHWQYGCLLVHRRLFDQPAKQRLLEKYYRRTWPEAVTAALQIAPGLRDRIPVITSSHIGYGLRVLEMQAQRGGRVIMTPNNLEELVARTRGIEQCYSIDRPLSGYRSTKVATVIYRKAAVGIYLNRKSRS